MEFLGRARWHVLCCPSVGAMGVLRSRKPWIAGALVAAAGLWLGACTAGGPGSVCGCLNPQPLPPCGCNSDNSGDGGAFGSGSSSGGGTGASGSSSSSGGSSGGRLMTYDDAGATPSTADAGSPADATGEPSADAGFEAGPGSDGGDGGTTDAAPVDANLDAPGD